MDREEAIKIFMRAKVYTDEECDDLKTPIPELRERIRKALLDAFQVIPDKSRNYNGSEFTCQQIMDWLEKQKENLKSADSIPSNCASDAKCGDRWQKVTDSLPDNGRLVLAQDCLGNTLLARYDGEANWEVSVYDNDDYYCRNTITRWCEIPSEKQKEQKPAEWSEEDEKMIEQIRRIVFGDGSVKNGEREKIHDWLKSLRPQPHWKPSEEQLNALRKARNTFDGSSYDYKAIDLLYCQLKELF